MTIEAESFYEESRSEQELIEIIEQRAYAKAKKRIRLISYVFQYLVPTLYVTILLLR
ncbi:MAG: hypothetical protein ACXACF_00440 [Candidatus Hermodarchaeia archaeon]